MVKTQHYIVCFTCKRKVSSVSQRESSTPKFYKHECKLIRFLPLVHREIRRGCVFNVKCNCFILYIKSVIYINLKILKIQGHVK